MFLVTLDDRDKRKVLIHNLKKDSEIRWSHFGGKTYLIEEGERSSLRLLILKRRYKEKLKIIQTDGVELSWIILNKINKKKFKV